LFRQDESIDAVHDAFVKCLEYLNKKPGSKVSSFLLFSELKRVCRRRNHKAGRELPFDFSRIEITGE